MREIDFERLNNNFNLMFFVIYFFKFIPHLDNQEPPQIFILVLIFPPLVQTPIQVTHHLGPHSPTCSRIFNFSTFNCFLSNFAFVCSIWANSFSFMLSIFFNFPKFLSTDVGANDLAPFSMTIGRFLMTSAILKFYPNLEFNQTLSGSFFPFSLLLFEIFCAVG